MSYERPAIEQKVKVLGPVIAGLAPVGSRNQNPGGVTPTPAWKHAEDGSEAK